MKLKEYLDKNDKMYNKVAKSIGCSHVYFNNLVNGKHYPSIELAMKIESYSKGEVSWKDLIDPSKLEKIGSCQVTCYEGKVYK